ncbi:MAG: class D beta-lactamase [Bacteroidia bacterium]
MTCRFLFTMALGLSLFALISCGGTPESTATEHSPPPVELNYTPPTQALFDSLFAQFDAQGTFLLQDIKADTIYVHNETRAKIGYLPASTFKIPNTLIALELGVVDTAEVFLWDGTKRFARRWNQDLKLPNAFRYSAVWVYQIIAERVGQERYREYLQKINYGNANPGPDVRMFWLDGDLRISAYEQVEFLRRLENGSLAFGKATQNTFREIFSFEKTTTYDWKAKTGWTTEPDPDIGWVVGWIERGEERYIYAMNLDVENDEHVKARVEIARAVFNSMGLLD